MIIRSALLITTLLFCSTPVSHNTPIKIEKAAPVKPTEELVYSELRKVGVKHAKIVLAQSKLETGRYRSRVSHIYHNLFGFRTKKGYIKFTRWEESVAYYKKWQDKHYKRSKYDSYYDFLLDIGYAEDTLYTQKIKKMVKES